MPPWLEIALVLAFVLVGGFFAASELAVISLRDSQVRSLAGRGARGAAVVRLRGDTNRFLSSVQIGVTLAGFFASSFGGATLAVRLKEPLEDAGVSVQVATYVGLAVVTVFVSYLSLVLGELVPKRLALQRTEPVALFVAPVLDKIATATRPVVWLLGVSTDALVRLIGLDPKASREEVSEEELREMVSSHHDLDAQERRIIDDVFQAGDRRLSEVMVPRTEVSFLPVVLTVEQAIAATEDEPHSRYPVIGDTSDDVRGFVHVRDLYAALRRGEDGTLADLVRPIAMLPGTKTVLPSLTAMRRTRRHLAVVVDEYGGTDGIVTLEDLVEELVGEIEDEYDAGPPTSAPDEEGGAVEVDALLHRSEVEEQARVVLPEGPYETLGGFVIATLGRLPEPGDSVEALERRFTVTEVEGRRPHRVRVELLTPVDDAAAGGGEADAAAGARG